MLRRTTVTALGMSAATALLAVSGCSGGSNRSVTPLPTLTYPGKTLLSAVDQTGTQTVGSFSTDVAMKFRFTCLGDGAVTVELQGNNPQVFGFRCPLTPYLDQTLAVLGPTQVTVKVDAPSTVRWSVLVSTEVKPGASGSPSASPTA